MKVEAYRCDHCGKLFEADSMVGINPIEDMFDRLSSYPTIPNPAKAEIHISLECYRDVVLIPAGNMVNRKKDEEGYKAKLKELTYGFRMQAVKNHRDATRHKKIS